MRISRQSLIAAAVGAALAAPVASFAEVRLPKVNISGQEYYVYEVKKGDSLYGIANRYGWKVDKLSELNPGQSVKLHKGAKIYYPTDSSDTSSQKQTFEAPESYPVVQHVVKRGETVYSISKMYDVAVDDIYASNPSSKIGIKAGEVIIIPQLAMSINDGDSFYYYTIRPGDTLYSVAKSYNTSIEQLLKDNKGISERNFRVGEPLRISVNSNKDKTETASKEETAVAYIDTYTASKDDTWETVAQKTGTDVEELMEANAGTKLKKDAEIAVPVVETTTVEVRTELKDEREESAEGRQEIYNEVHGVSDMPDNGKEEVKMVLVIEDPTSKRDSEFTRGMFLALDKMKDSPYSISLKVVQDTGNDSEKIKQAISDFGGELVVATYEKNFPGWLVNYGEENGIEIVNSFDVKSETYLDTPSMIHLLTPSVYFYDEVAEWADGMFDDRTLVMIGKEDPSDGMAEALLAKREGRTVLRFSIEDIPNIPMTNNGRYLFYGYPTSKEEITSMLDAIKNIKESNPFADIKVFGRPNWITMGDAMSERFAEGDVYFPSRFFFDHTDSQGKKFIADYSAAYGHGPIRSFPTYAVAGYDIANYFVPGLAANDGDFNAAIPQGNELQTPIKLRRSGNWGGFFNPSVYVIHYRPYGDIEKILISQ